MEAKREAVLKNEETAEFQTGSRKYEIVMVMCQLKLRFIFQL